MTHWQRPFVTVLLVTGAFVGAAALATAGVPPSAAAMAAPCQPRLFQRVPPEQAPKVCPRGIAAPSQANTTTVAAATPQVSGFVDQTVFNGLNRPTAVRFAADGRVFVASRTGRSWSMPASTRARRRSSPIYDTRWTTTGTAA